MKKIFSWQIWILFLFTAAAFCWTYFVSFRTPIVVDCGVLIDRSWRIFMGQVPGKDFYCPTTPVTYFIQALIFKIFSPEVLWMKIYLAFEMALLTFCTGLFTWKVMNLKFKYIALAVLPLMVVWLPGIHLMIPWYDIDALSFSFVTLCLLGLSFSNFGNRESLFLFLAGVASGLSFLSKQNIGGGCVIAGIIYILFQPFSLKAKIKHTVLFSLGILTPVCLIVLYFIYNHALKDAIHWMFVRAGQRYGEGNLINAMWKSNLEALTGPRNNFLKFLLPFYLWGVFVTWEGRKNRMNLGNIFFGTALYCLVAMWIGILQEGGVRYSTQQIYLGILCGILASSILQFKDTQLFKKLLKAILISSFLLMLVWGASMRWRQPYDANEIRWTVDHPKIKGIYFRQSDCEIVKGLIEFEKTIPKNERIFIMPDPLFFYFATDRVSPVPITHFLVSGWELNDREQKLIPELLEKENVKWVIVGQEQYFDTGFLRFGSDDNWKTAIKKNTPMMSRANYASIRDFIDRHYKEVTGPKGFWVLKRRN